MAISEFGPVKRLGSIDDLVQRGKALVLDKKYDDALVAFQNAYDICKELDDDKNRLELIWLVSDCLVSSGKYDDAEAGLSMGLDLARSHNDIGARIRFLGVLASSKSAQDEHRQALGPLNEALELCRTYRDRGGERFIMERLAHTYRAAGRLDKALEMFKKFAIRAGQAHHEQKQVVALVCQAEILAEQGEVQEATEVFEKAQAICLDCGQNAWAEDIKAKGQAIINDQTKC